MALKSLAEIAFDAFQKFAPAEKCYVHTDGKAGLLLQRRCWDELLDYERVVWERVAGSMQTEIMLREAINYDQ